MQCTYFLFQILCLLQKVSMHNQSHLFFDWHDIWLPVQIDQYIGRVNNWKKNTKFPVCWLSFSNSFRFPWRERPLSDPLLNVPRMRRWWLRPPPPDFFLPVCVYVCVCFKYRLGLRAHTRLGSLLRMYVRGCFCACVLSNKSLFRILIASGCDLSLERRGFLSWPWENRIFIFVCESHFVYFLVSINLVGRSIGPLVVIPVTELKSGLKEG